MSSRKAVVVGLTAAAAIVFAAVYGFIAWAVSRVGAGRYIGEMPHSQMGGPRSAPGPGMFRQGPGGEW